MKPIIRRLTVLLVSAGPAVGFAADTPSQPAPVNVEYLFPLYDKNGDDRLSREEFTGLAAESPRLRDNPVIAGLVFKRMDENGDGVLTKRELETGIEAMRQPRDPEPAPPRAFGPRPGRPGMPANPRTTVGDSPEQIAYFEKNIRPLLVTHCYECHSAQSQKLKGGLALDTREGIRRGGDTGPAVVPGDLEKSLLIKAVRWHEEEFRMPPKQKLPDTAIAALETWVRNGAADPRDGRGVVSRPEMDLAEGRKFWAFQPPRDVPPPAVKDAGWPRSTIDRHLLAAMESRGVKPVGDADRASLLRRLSFDLTGLPPSPEQVEAFLADRSADAVEKVVDQLLASPAFGERWGRHWLDVARYAESSGKLVNINYPHAWRYRDWVIDAFAADKPFDQFIREQVAGDLLPARDDAQRSANLIATGFLAIGSKSHAERNRLQFELDLVDEQIDALTQSVLGMTVACARCHDHKFDPISQKDYYALAGIFRSTETLFGTPRTVQANQTSDLIELPRGAKSPAAVPPLNAEARALLEQQLADLKKQRQEIFAQGREAAAGNVQLVLIISRINLLEARLATYDADGTPKSLAMGARDRRRPTDSPLYVRGETDQPAELVQRAIPQVLSNGQPLRPSGSGRLELADFLASPRNPLTARVWVNRVWLHLFGQGLVPTPDNFGASGTPPTNQALLDHLAVTFMQDGWSTKKMIRRLVLTRAYQLATQHHDRNAEIDPENTLVWRATQRRLDAEGIRDSILAVAGKISTSRPTGSPVAVAGDGPAVGLQRPLAGRFGGGNNNADDGRRSVYLPIVRDQLPEALATFDFAEPSMVTGQRATTSVPAQSLYLLNSPFVINAADAAATRLRNQTPDESARVRKAYLALYGRAPTADEAEAAMAFLNRYTATIGSAGSDPSPAARHDAWTAFVQALMGSAEFLYLN